jgi:hypothetical protein
LSILTLLGWIISSGIGVLNGTKVLRRHPSAELPFDKVIAGASVEVDSDFYFRFGIFFWIFGEISASAYWKSAARDWRDEALG